MLGGDLARRGGRRVELLVAGLPLDSGTIDLFVQRGLRLTEAVERRDDARLPVDREQPTP